MLEPEEKQEKSKRWNKTGRDLIDLLKAKSGLISGGGKCCVFIGKMQEFSQDDSTISSRTSLLLQPLVSRSTSGTTDPSDRSDRRNRCSSVNE